MKLSGIMLISLLVVALPLTAQEKSRKERREEVQAARRQEVSQLMNTREFKFVARTAQPSGRPSVDLTTNPGYVDFRPSFIESDMPFFGRAFAGSGLSGGSPMEFSGEPEEFTVEEKRKEYQVNAVVKSGTNQYKLILNVGHTGGATLSITSSNYSVISYLGDIEALKTE